MPERLCKWLPLIISVVVVIVTAAVAWGSLYERASRNEVDIDSNCDRIIMVENAIPEMQTNIEWIRETLTRMELEKR